MVVHEAMWVNDIPIPLVKKKHEFKFLVLSFFFRRTGMDTAND